jgi:hypothetical protein
MAHLVQGFALKKSYPVTATVLTETKEQQQET